MKILQLFQRLPYMTLSVIFVFIFSCRSANQKKDDRIRVIIDSDTNNELTTDRSYVVKNGKIRVWFGKEPHVL